MTQLSKTSNGRTELAHRKCQGHSGSYTGFAAKCNVAKPVVRHVYVLAFRTNWSVPNLVREQNRSDHFVTEISSQISIHAEHGGKKHCVNRAASSVRQPTALPPKTSHSQNLLSHTARASKTKEMGPENHADKRAGCWL